MRGMVVLGSVAFGAVACSRPCPDPDTCDLDGDGIEAADDCDDTDAAIGVAQGFYPDCDGDGAAAAGSVETLLCDADPALLFDVCGGGGQWRGSDEPRDDCDDTDPDAQSEGPWTADCDGDGAYGSPLTVCGPPEGAELLALCGVSEADVVEGTDVADCDDMDPDATDVQTWRPDCDADGAWGPGVDACGEPDDTMTATVCGAAGADWALDDPGLSDDCFDDDATLIDGTWYVDCDGDGYFDASVYGGCDAPGAVCGGGADPVDTTLDAPDPADCADEDATRYPGAPETAGDAVDSDCDGLDDPAPSDADGTFAASDGAGTVCSKAAPCATVSQAHARAVTLGVPNVYVAEGTIVEPNTITLQKDVYGALDRTTWLPGGAESIIERTSPGPVFTIPSGNGRLIDISVTSVNGGIQISGGTPTVVGGVLRGTTALRMTDGSLVVEGTTFLDDNQSIDQRGGVLVLRNCAIAGQTGALNGIGAIGSGASTVMGIEGCTIAASRPLVMSEGFLDVVGADIIGGSSGIRFQNGATGSVADTDIRLCDGGFEIACAGIETTNGVVIDDTRIFVGGAAAAGNFVYGVRQLGFANDTLVNDSVIVMDAGAATAYGVMADNAGSTLTLANSAVYMESGGRSSTAVMVDTDANARVLSSVLSPLAAGTDVHALYLWSRTTVEVHDTRLARSAGTSDIRRAVPNPQQIPWSSIADDCTGMGELCVSASNNTVGDPGFNDPANGDWRLRDDAFCRDAGGDTSAYVAAVWRATDLLGVPRDSTPDCGPTEWVPGQF